MNRQLLCFQSVSLAAWLALCLMLPAQLQAAGFERAQWERQGWVTEWDAGMQRARASGKPAFVYFDAGWCSWCQQYKRDVLDTPRVRAVLARDFIRVAVDFDARPDLMRRYGGKGLPFTLVLSPDGTVLGQFVGVMPADDLLDLLATLVRRSGRHPEVVREPGEVLHRPAALDRKNYTAFRAAYMRHLDALYDPARETISGQFESGTTFRRTALLTWIYLMDHGLWNARTQRAAQADRKRLWDPVGKGFFNFVDPTRADYLESSKLLEINAWMMARQAQLGAHDPEARQLAGEAWEYLRTVLWDPAHGGFFQSQLADNAYYALPPLERLRKQAPPVDRAKRADSNAQAVWALLHLSRFDGRKEVLDHAALTMDFLLREMWRDGRLYHLWRDGRLFSPDLPHSWFWVLAAGAELEQVRPDRIRRQQLAAIAATAGRWLDVRMRNAAAPRLDNELAGLIALAAGHRRLYPGIPPGARDWALSQLRIETETPPDEPVIGLWAWEARLAAPPRR